jgi:AsmA protein
MKKLLKIAGITFGAILLLLVLLLVSPLIFREKFAAIVKSTANKQLKTEMNFSGMEISFFHHFPNLTVTLTDFTLKSSPPFNNDTLVRARDISFGVNLASLFGGPVKVSRVYINKGRFILKYNEKGASNFDVVNSSTDTAKKAESSGTAAIRIEEIIFVKTDFIYADPSIPLQISAHGINYRGKTDITKDIMHLTSKVQIDSLDFAYDKVYYLRSKPVKAQLVTSIDLNSLNMKFEKNDMRIMDIPFEFRGEFNFRKDGYTFFLSLFSQMGEEYFSGSMWLVSTKTLWISVKTDISLNLENWAKGFGLKEYGLKGLFSMKLNADGEYATGQNPASKTPDTVLLSIPDFNLKAKMSGGYFRYRDLPSALSGISFDLNASSEHHDYRTIHADLENMKAGFLNNRIEGSFHVKGLEDLPVEGHLSTHVNLAELRQVIPLDSLDVKGMLDVNLDINGKYNPDKKLFPVTSLKLDLKDGYLKTKYSPQPLENIVGSVKIDNRDGKLSGTRIQLEPVSFTFVGNPFEVRADLQNPDNLSYNVSSKGSVDVGKLYQLFAIKGMDVNGFISTDLVLKGSLADATAGKYDRLNNKGKLILRDMTFNSEDFSKPLILKAGVFRFDNDNIWFEKFDAKLGASSITLDGHLSNVVNYYLSDKAILKGTFKFQSDYLLLDEFMAAGQPETETAAQVAPAPGVFVIPDNYEIGLKADIKKITFRKLEIDSLKSTVEVKKGLLLMKSMTLRIIGCKVGMEATYGSINPARGYFDFHIKAEDFDVKRAYNEVELFRNLVTSAGKCEGIVSIDYSLKGDVGPGMSPIYPSLEGGGVLSLKKVKVMGLKLFTAMSKNLEKEKLKDPDLSKIDLKTTIKKNVITLEKTKLKFSGFRFRMAGQTNFDGKLNLKTRLGLPPLGIVGIPIRVLGTQDDPKFKYGRGNGDEDVEETEYSDTIPPDMLNKIKAAKTEDINDEDK